MKISLLLMVFIISFSSFASENLSCVIKTQEKKTHRVLFEEQFNVVTEEGVENLVAVFYGGKYFVRVDRDVQRNVKFVSIIHRDRFNRLQGASSAPEKSGTDAYDICGGYTCVDLNLKKVKEMSSVDCALIK